MAWWWLPALIAVGWPALNFAIRRRLTAPRVEKTGDPAAPGTPALVWAKAQPGNDLATLAGCLGISQRTLYRKLQARG